MMGVMSIGASDEVVLEGASDVLVLEGRVVGWCWLVLMRGWC